VQHHEILRYEDPHRIFDEDAANAALVEARQAGKLRYIGFTGHKAPRIHLHMPEVANDAGPEFDTVQMPLNGMDAHYRSFEKLVPVRPQPADRRSSSRPPSTPSGWVRSRSGSRS
jgi:aryl-alcohol dehydrogenase-like predicted oxidoreductase